MSNRDRVCQIKPTWLVRSVRVHVLSPVFKYLASLIVCQPMILCRTKILRIIANFCLNFNVDEVYQPEVRTELRRLSACSVHVYVYRDSVIKCVQV